MHSKLMLLSHPTHLRVAVPTANLVPYDWGESGDMENMVFLIDLPRLRDGKRTAPEDLTFFGRELIYFLEAMGLERSIINSIYNFDFAATKDLAFVHTIGGAHAGEDDPWRRTGYCGLGRAVRELGLAAEKVLKIDFVTSSVGSLNIDFLAMLYLAAQGDDGSTEYQWRNPVAAKGKSKQSKAAPNGAETAQGKLKDHIRENFHIYFPTHETVKSSTAGGAGTICLQSKWYNSPIFPRQAMRDCKSTRTGLLMHNKVKRKTRLSFLALTIHCRSSMYAAKAKETQRRGRTSVRLIAQKALGGSYSKTAHPSHRSSTAAIGNAGYLFQFAGMEKSMNIQISEHSRVPFQSQCNIRGNRTATGSHGTTPSNRKGGSGQCLENALGDLG